MSLPWMTEAIKHNNKVREIPGPNHNPTIIGWLKSLRAWWLDDEVPWCGTYVGHCMKTAGLTVPKLYMRAKEWGNGWGVKLPEPLYGCVVVFERQGGGHVGFVVGQTKEGLLAVLGGNQGNAVNVTKFTRDRVVGYYWPRDYTLPANGMFAALPVVTVGGNVSLNEA